MIDIDHTRQHPTNRRHIKRAARGVVLAALVLAAPGALIGRISAASPLTGRLVVSATTVKAGTPFTVTEEATNLGSVPLSGIKTAVSRARAQVGRGETDAEAGVGENKNVQQKITARTATTASPNPC